MSHSTFRSSLPAKLTPPAPGRVFPRPELQRTLVELAQTHRKLWVCGPGGAGKTALVRDHLAGDARPLIWYQVDAGDADPAGVFFYLAQAAAAAAPDRAPLPLLAPEFLPNLEVFSRNFFRSLFAAFDAGCALVFDDCQEGPDPEFFGLLLAAAMAELPESSSLFVIQSGGAYPQLARLRLNRYLARLGWEELRFSAEESGRFLAWAATREISAPIRQQAYQMTHGWVAGLMLYLESRPEDLPPPHRSKPEQPELVFDYFAGEIFARLPEECQAFLLACGFLPSVGVAMAETLTGRDDAAAILQTLARQDRFSACRLPDRRHPGELPPPPPFPAISAAARRAGLRPAAHPAGEGRTPPGSSSARGRSRRPPRNCWPGSRTGRRWPRWPPPRPRRCCAPGTFADPAAVAGGAPRGALPH